MRGYLESELMRKVLAIFQEVGVNETLYFLVFGESLLNDAVTVVLNNMMKAFVVMDEIPTSQMAIGVASFFTISLGGLAIGVCFGILTALLTRTTYDVRLIEPLAILILAYLSYIVAELFHWSGIISIIGCGIVQAQYAFHNISRKSFITVNYFIKMTSATCDCMIFLYLGIEVLQNRHEWNTGFVLWSTFYCLVFRFVVVFGLSLFLNNVRGGKKINFEDQFIMWYGGLRGAVCFALCETIDPKFRHKNMFLTTTFFIIFMTVFVQGMTIKPLVKLCKVKRKSEEASLMIEELTTRVVDHTMTGMEVIAQQKGNYFVRHWLTTVNDDYLSRWLQNDPMTQDEKILQTYGNMVMVDYENNITKQYLHPEESAGWSHFYIKPVGDQHDKSGSQTLYIRNEGDGILRRKSGEGSRRKTSDRRSISDVLLGRRTLSNEMRPTVTDVHSILEQDSRTTSDIMRQLYDPNLRHDDSKDLMQQLEERHRRIERSIRATYRASQAHSSMEEGQYSPFPKHRIKQGHHPPLVKASPIPPPHSRPPFTQQSSIREEQESISFDGIDVQMTSQQPRSRSSRGHTDSESSL